MIIIDNNVRNSDWIKFRTLDVAGVDDFAALERLIALSKSPKDRLAILKSLPDRYGWYNALKNSIKGAIKIEIAHLEEQISGKRNA